ncbi:hypothetical protein TNCV_3923281 [Trichonephila clavipes]|nr:hypothetical protein TNCV_3923281 [Trichonephila clavipes]
MLGNFTYAEKAGMHYVKMINAELRYKCITRSFLIDECRIKEFFSGYIVNFETGSFHDRLGMVDQSHGHPCLPIYRASIGHDIIIEPWLLFMRTSVDSCLCDSTWLS